MQGYLGIDWKTKWAGTGSALMIEAGSKQPCFLVLDLCPVIVIACQNNHQPVCYSDTLSLAKKIFV
jgi:hypothetical protein